MIPEDGMWVPKGWLNGYIHGSSWLRKTNKEEEEEEQEEKERRRRRKRQRRKRRRRTRKPRRRRRRRRERRSVRRGRRRWRRRKRRRRRRRWWWSWWRERGHDGTIPADLSKPPGQDSRSLTDVSRQKAGIPSQIALLCPSRGGRVVKRLPWEPETRGSIPAFPVPSHIVDLTLFWLCKCEWDTSPVTSNEAWSHLYSCLRDGVHFVLKLRDGTFIYRKQQPEAIECNRHFPATARSHWV